jgi:hypothetical protein
MSNRDERVSYAIVNVPDIAYAINVKMNLGAECRNPDQLIGQNTGRQRMSAVKTIAIPRTTLGPSLIPLLSSESKYLISPADEEKPSDLSFAIDVTF